MIQEWYNRQTVKTTRFTVTRPLDVTAAACPATQCLLAPQRLCPGRQLACVWMIITRTKVTAALPLPWPCKPRPFIPALVFFAQFSNGGAALDIDKCTLNWLAENRGPPQLSFLLCKCRRSCCHRQQARCTFSKSCFPWAGLVKNLLIVAFQFVCFTDLPTVLTAFLPVNWNLMMTLA